MIDSHPTHDEMDELNYSIEHPTVFVPESEATEKLSSNSTRSVSPLMSTASSPRDIVVNMEPISTYEPTLQRGVPTPFTMAKQLEQHKMTPLAYSRLIDEQLEALKSTQHKERIRSRALCLLVVFVSFLTIIAFVGVVLYLSHKIGANITTNSITTTEIQDNAITASKISAGAVSMNNLAPSLADLVSSVNTTYQESLGKIPIAGAGILENFAAGTLSVNVDQKTLTINSLNQVTIQNGGVTSSLLASGSVGPDQLQSASVTAVSIAQGSVSMVALGSDVLNSFSQLNSSVMDAWDARPRAGVATQVDSQGHVSLLVNTSTFALDTSSALTIAPQGISGDMIATGAITYNKLSPDVTELIASAGSGLYSSNTSGSIIFNVQVDETTITLNSAGMLSLANNSVGSAQLRNSTVDMSKLSPSLQTFIASINATSNAAMVNAQTLANSQTLLQHQLLSLVNTTDGDLLSGIATNSFDLYASLNKVNASITSLVLNMNTSVFTLFTGIQNNLSAINLQLQSDSSKFQGLLPQPGKGLQYSPLYSNEFDLMVDPSLFFVTTNTNFLTLIVESINSLYIASLAVTTSKLANMAVETPNLADASVTFSKFAADVSALYIFLNYNTSSLATGQLTLGDPSSASPVTVTTNEANLILQASIGGSVILASNQNGTSIPVIVVQNSSVNIDASALTITSDTMSLKSGSSLTAFASQFTFSTTSSSVTLDNAGFAALAGNGSISMSASDQVSINSAKTISLAAPNGISMSAAVQYVPITYDINNSSTYTIDFSSLPASIVRLNGFPSSSVIVEVLSCTNAIAGYSVTLVNQMMANANLVVPSAICGMTIDSVIASNGFITLTCAGTYQNIPMIDCARSERQQGGYGSATSSATIFNNTQDGIISTNTSAGIIRLVFTPSSNPLIVSFIISSPLLVAPNAAGAVHITPVLSGTVNSAYSDSKQSALFVCASQSLVEQSLTVKVINVADALYVDQEQILAFTYLII